MLYRLLKMSKLWKSYIKAQRFFRINIKWIQNCYISFILNFKINTPILSCCFFLIFFRGIIAIYEIFNISIYISRYPSTTCSIEFHCFYRIFIACNSDFNFFARYRAVYFICKRLLKGSRSQGFLNI